LMSGWLTNGLGESAGEFYGDGLIGVALEDRNES
jgi:hypothetical protein